MTAPKIYVPSPGRPPEWVVDLMVEGRLARFRDRLYHVSPHESRWSPEVREGQAIRLNEDGSLEIIDAPKDEPEPTFTKSEVVEALEATRKFYVDVRREQRKGAGGALLHLAGYLGLEWPE